MHLMRGGCVLCGWLGFQRCFGVGRLQGIGYTAEQLNKLNYGAQCMQRETFFLAAVTASTAGSVAFCVIMVALLVPMFRRAARVCMSGILHFS